MTPISIMKKRSSNPIELRRSSGAVKIDLSSADKTIRRPGSEPDLKTSPMRSSMRQSTCTASAGTTIMPNSQNCSESANSSAVKRLSGISQGSIGKKVMFSGVASDEEPENEVISITAEVAENQAKTASQGLKKDH